MLILFESPLNVAIAAEFVIGTGTIRRLLLGHVGVA